jgi:uncharacterized protein YuzE
MAAALLGEATMKIEYDPQHDLVYLWLSTPGQKAASTVTVAPGLFADLDTAGNVIGIEILDASEVLGGKVQFEVELRQLQTREPVVANRAA